MRVNRDQTDAALVLRIAERFDDSRLRHALAVAAHDVEADEIAVGGVALVAGMHRPLLERLAVDGINRAAAAARGLAEDPHQATAFARQPLDRLGLVRVAEDVGALQPIDARKDAVADAQRAVAVRTQRRAAPSE